MNVLLDTSALVAFFFGEPGSLRVQEILSDGDVTVGLSVLSAGEFWSRLRAEGWEQAFDQEWGQISELIAFHAPVTMQVVRKSIELRSAASSRVPQIDSLIAATAVTQDAVLVHRDPHFLSIPASLLQQEYLEEG